VLNAMQEQDADLVQIIREMREAKGRNEVFDPRRLSEKIEILGPSVELSALRSNICAEIADEIGVSWDEWYGRLTRYKGREGNCNVPATYKENGYHLGRWVVRQRTNQNLLSKERRRRLDELGFDWAPYESLFEKGFSHLKLYKERVGDCRVPFNHIENGFKLGSWANTQRTNKNSLSDEHRQRLEEIGFIWDLRKC